MNRPFYSEYARHCMRFYARNINKVIFSTEVDMNNWFACRRALEGYSDKDRDILIRIFAMYDTLADNVYEVSKLYSIDQNIIWDLIKNFERNIAQQRGLI